jgi:hypothetical protein
VIIGTGRWIGSAARFCFGGVADSDVRRGTELRLQGLFIIGCQFWDDSESHPYRYNIDRAELLGAVLNK